MRRIKGKQIEVVSGGETIDGQSAVTMRNVNANVGAQITFAVATMTRETEFPVSQSANANENGSVGQVVDLANTPDEVTSEDASITLADVAGNTIYRYGELTALTLTTITASQQASFIYFTSGTTATTLNIPNNTPHIGDLTINASTSYIIGVFDGIIAVKEVE